MLGRKTFAGHLPTWNTSSLTNCIRGPIYPDYPTFLLQDEDPQKWRADIIALSYGDLVSRKGNSVRWRGEHETVRVSPGKLLRSLAPPPAFQLDGWIPSKLADPTVIYLADRGRGKRSTMQQTNPHYMLHLVRLASIDGREEDAYQMLLSSFNLEQGMLSGLRRNGHSRSWLRKRPARLAISRILLAAMERGQERLADLIIREAGFPAHRDDPILWMEPTGKKDLSLAGSKPLHGFRWARRRIPTWLACAIVRGRVAIVEALLQRPASNEGSMAAWMAPLILAITCCLPANGNRSDKSWVRAQLNICSLLLNHGYDPMATVRQGKVSCLDLAAATQNIDLLMLILQRLERMKSMAAPHALLLQSDLDVTIRLLKAGISPNQHTPKLLNTPLHRAAAQGQTDLVAVLLHFGASIDAQNRLGRTPLHEAAREGHREVIRYLISAGADCSLEDCQGQTALQTALRHGVASEDLYDYFRELDADDRLELDQLIQQVDAFSLHQAPMGNRRRGRFLIERLSQWFHPAHPGREADDTSLGRRLLSRFSSVND